MQKIALSRIGTWFDDALADVREGWTNYGAFGLISTGVVLLPWVATQFVTCCVTKHAGVVMFISFVLSQICPAISAMGLTGVATARLHGREGTEEDYRQDLSVLGQTLLGALAQSALTLTLAAVAALPGLAVAAPGFFQENQGLAITGVVLFIIGGVVGALAGSTLALFTVPLVVERRMDFWTALWQSVDCVRRDFFGILIFQLLVHLALTATLLLTCLLSFPLVVAAREALMMRCYRDYFGLGQDHCAPLQVVGYSHYGNPPPAPWEAGLGGRGYSASVAPVEPPPAPGEAERPPQPVTLPILPLAPLPKEEPFPRRDGLFDAVEDKDLPPPPPPA